MTEQLRFERDLFALSTIGLIALLLLVVIFGG